MAMAVHMQPPPTRPSMDRSASLDQPPPPRSRSTPPFSSASHYDRSPSPAVRPPHSRTPSNASASSPYQQPFPHSYFPPAPGQMYGNVQQPQAPVAAAWSSTPLPANAFYPPPHLQSYPGQVFHQGFQQSQADFAAWANAYHHMVAASMNGMSPPQPEYMDDRRRTNSGPTSVQHYNQGYQEFSYPQHHQLQHQHQPAQHPQQHPFQNPLQHQHQHQTQHHPQHQHQPQQHKPSQPFHPYKRGPPNRPSRENVNVAGGGIPRTVSTPILPSTHERSPSSSTSTRAPDQHVRTASLESSSSSAPRVPSRRDSLASDNDRGGSAGTNAIAPRSESPGSKTASPTIKLVSQPLHTGPIANATNTASNTSRPSPLSQAIAPSPEPEKIKSGGFKNKFKRSVDKDNATPKKQSTPPQATAKPPPPTSKPTFASLFETSTRPDTPPTTPPQTSDLPRPSAPFAVSHSAAMDSEVSLAETERTATVGGAGTSKPKRSLFRMKNMSTDNISLSSTVSSASMMIRKMGSIGKLARRNSLMGISKIFKDKPKDEDAALPEKEGKKKKKSKKSKKDKTKGDAAPAEVSHAIVENEPALRVSDEDDRALAGLSPAAKLARQHTLRSKAEAEARREAERVKPTGEPAWDNNTATRHQGSVLPSISSITSMNGAGNGTEVVRVTPHRTSTVVHALAVSEHEYDSEDDSSDGETVEDVTLQLGRASLSDGAADREFREAWGNAFIDKHAVPKKGILKNTVSIENLESTANRQRSNSTAEVPQVSHHGPMTMPKGDADQIDGLHHHAPTQAHSTSHAVEEIYDPFSPAFSPFDPPAPGSEANFPYSNPSHNTSAPTLSLATAKPVTARSLTVPARKRLIWAPECAVYSTYDPGTYDRRSELATCNRLTPELALAIKQELNAFKLEMPVHPTSRIYTHYFA